ETSRPDTPKKIVRAFGPLSQACDTVSRPGTRQRRMGMTRQPRKQSAARTRPPVRQRGGEPELRAVTAVVSAMPEVFAPDLTPRQRRIMEFLRQWSEEHGYPPSVREVGEAVGLDATPSVGYRLKVRGRKGYLRREARRRRAVDVRSGSELVEERAGRRPARAFVPMLCQIAAGGPSLA